MVSLMSFISDEFFWMVYYVAKIRDKHMCKPQVFNHPEWQHHDNIFSSPNFVGNAKADVVYVYINPYILYIA